ncbi:uncharacterized protein LOC120352839 [Nilaparvata lugens]|uniref:uncharacterized protein LOC120352839 n=1 Tax=Nilaparvata lugens TaxID=108931 RepID=UPI00193D63CB|nr:uncharacterized protein LOC120352839 [Nilaparvata lugens]
MDEESLPPIEEFYSSLCDSTISADDYRHAQTVWKHFNCRTLGQYSDLYLKTDVLLLADIMESFRNISLETFKLDPAHYFTLPGFSFDAMLKYTKIKLELLTDYSMYAFFHSSIRGGIVTCVHRHAVANNHYTGAPYNTKKPNSFLAFLDINNLYGYSMCAALPRANFAWMSRDEIDNAVANMKNWSKDQTVGYVLEVDIEYPKDLHDAHNDFPFLAKNQKVFPSNQTRLITSLTNHTNYVCHYLLLKQAIEHGLKLTNIRRGISFEQSKFLEPYISLNTQLRQQSKNKFQKDFHKLLNNVIFGKSCMNLWKQMDLKLVNNEKSLLKYIARPSFKDRLIFGKNICGITLHKENILLNNPIYIGFSILDLSKTVMYSFHYDVIRKIYGPSAKLLYQDTDSLMYLIKTADFYWDIRTNEDLKHWLDTSNYPVDHPAYSTQNRMVVGKMKDEFASKAPYQFLGLRSKLWACRLYNEIIGQQQQQQHFDKETEDRLENEHDIKNY